MKIAVVGTGNVGAALLFPLAYNEVVGQVAVISRKAETAMAAIMDVASAFPKGAAKMAYEPVENISEADVIVITAGVTQKGKRSEETYEPNFRIAESVIGAGTLKKSAVVICLATPVDYLTVDVQRKSGLPANQVIGFGGDLDSNRLRYILHRRNRPNEDAHAIGEHGPNAVPVYQGEEDYQEVTRELEEFWSKIARHVDIVRNLATADLLARLVDSIVRDGKIVHNICAYHGQHGLYLTWPFVVGRLGAEQPVDMVLPERAAKAFADLVAARKHRLEVASAPV